MIKDCKHMEAEILDDVKSYVQYCHRFGVVIPKLFMLQLGKDSASSNYVSRKEMKCANTGLLSDTLCISHVTDIGDVKSIIQNRNLDPKTHGIMIQQPSPLSELENEMLLQSVCPSKDVDGFTHFNVGALANKSEGLIPCTAKGVIDILDVNEIDVTGKVIHVVGKGRTSGKPIAQMLQNKGATVLSSNSRTSPLDFQIFNDISDIIISCTGQKHLIKGGQVNKPVSAIINVGMTWEEVEGRMKLFGDVDTKSFDNEFYEDTLVTTVSGSTGLLTVAHLLMNTCIAHFRQLEKELYQDSKAILKDIIKGYL